MNEQFEKNDLFGCIVEAAPNAMILVNREGLIVLINLETENLFGYSRSELVGRPIETLVPQRYQGHHSNYRDTFYSDPKKRSMGAGRDLFGLRKDGSEVPIEIGLNPIDTVNGMLVLVSIIDISERKRAEERFRQVVEASPSAMIMVNQDGHIVLINVQTEKLFGYNRSELLGCSIEILVPDRFKGAHPNHRGGFFANPTVRSMGEGRELFGRRKDATEVPIEIGLNPIATDEGQFVLASIIDISERKRLESDFRLMVEGVQDYALIMLDTEGNVSSWNLGAERFKGYLANEVIGRNFSIFYLPEEIASGRPGAELQMAKDQGRVEAEGWRVRKNGTKFWANIIITALREKNGMLRGFLKITRDLTERRLMAERFRHVVEAAPNAMIMIDKSGKIVLVNLQTEKLFGYRRIELLGNKVEMLVPDQFQGNHPNHREGFFKNPQTRAMGIGRELFGRRKDGTNVPIEIGLNPIEMTDGVFVLASIIDITERKRAEERFRLVVEAAPNAMIMVDKDGKIVLANLQTERLFGYSREELLLQRIEILVPNRFRTEHPGHRDSFFNKPSTRSMGVGRDLFGQRKDGSEVPIEIGLNPIETEEGLFTLASIIDITERKGEAQKAMEQKNIELLRANEELSQFAYRTSHDLRAPMRTIQGLARYVESDVSSGNLDEAKLNIRKIINQTNKLDLLVGDILNLARADLQETMQEVVDFSSIIVSIQERLSDLIVNNQVNVSYEISLKEVYKSGTLRMTQILENLISNGVKYCNPNNPQKYVKISVSESDSNILLKVEDNGVGIPKANQKEVFKMFARFHPTLSFGSGLGMSIVKKHLDKMGAEIKFSSSEAGTLFEIQLPKGKD